MKSKADSSSIKTTANDAVDELDSLNAQERRDGDVARFMEATLETKTKKRRKQEAPSSSSWKST